MIPRILQADAYTIGSGPHVSQDAKDYSAYQLIFRQRPAWMDELGCESKIIFHGMQRIMRDVLAPQVTASEALEAQRFLNTFHAGQKPFVWDQTIWGRIIQERNGILPIRMWGLRDGTTCFPGEPVIQIEAMDGFGELAGYFESKLLQVWAPSERATLMRHWLDYNKKLVKKCTSSFIAEDELNFLAALQTHDFGDRAGSCSMESEVLGMAHLTSHFGTDTVAAAYLAYEEAGGKPIGNSIKALAHRIVQGYEKEKDAYLSLYHHEPATFTSHVADCYNFYNAIDSYLVPLAKLAKESGGVIVARPDSGDPYEQILYVLEAAVEAGLYEDNNRNGLRSMTHLRVIQGDGMDFKTIMEINEKLLKKKFNPPGCLCYGIGGHLRNVLARDNFGATLKLCAVGKSKRPVMKFSHTPGKGSIPGLVKIVRIKQDTRLTRTVRYFDEIGTNEMVLWYDGIDGKGPVYHEPFDVVRARVLKDFDKYPMPEAVVSDSINAVKKELHAKYVYHTEV